MGGGGGGVKGERQVQPIRDEMELLESERRILSPGCCTEEREKKEGRAGGREGEEGGTELRTMPHAALLFTLRGERQERV